MDVGTEIRRVRETKGWSQAKLAGAADMGVSGISQIETGTRNPSVTTLAKIAEALDVGVADLFPKAQAPLPDFEVKRREATDVALDAAKRQADHDRKAANRSLASDGISQPAYFKDYENAAVHQLLGYPADELAGALLELALRVVRLEENLAATDATLSVEDYHTAVIAAFLAENERENEPQQYSTLLEEKGFSSEQIAAWLSQNERGAEFIRDELEKMSAKDFREALLASPALRRIRDHYRATNVDPSVSPRSETA